jgi:hypothetical protein
MFDDNDDIDVEPDHDDDANFIDVDAEGEDEPVAEADEEDADATEDDDDQVDGDDDDDDAEPDTVTVKYGDVEYTVPKGLEKAIMQEADYTQKSQTLAQERAQWAGQRQAAEAASQLQASQFEDAVKLAAIDARIAEYDEVDWQELLQADQHNGTNIAQQLDLERRQLTDTRAKANQDLADKSNQASVAHHETMARAAQQTRKALSDKYSDWSPELEERMAQVALKAGIPEQRLRTTVDQPSLELLYKAEKYDAIMEKQRTAAEKKPKPKPAAPAAKVKGRKQGGGKSPDKMTTDEWVSWREKQLARKAVQ